MSFLIYLETNWIVGAVMGQDPLADDLLDSALSFSIAVPSVCIMEAISAFDWKRIDRNRLKGELDNQLRQLQRSRNVQSAQELASELTQANLTNARLLTELFARLDDYLAKLAHQTTLLPLTPEVIELQLKLIRQTELDRDDALIPATVLSDAEKRPTDEKAFLTENVKDFKAEPVKRHLRKAGVKQFSSTRRILSWLAQT